MKNISTLSQEAVKHCTKAKDVVSPEQKTAIETVKSKSTSLVALKDLYATYQKRPYVSGGTALASDELKCQKALVNFAAAYEGTNKAIVTEIVDPMGASTTDEIVKTITKTSEIADAFDGQDLSALAAIASALVEGRPRVLHP